MVYGFSIGNFCATVISHFSYCAMQVFGVEPTGANAMAQSLAVGERIVLSRVDAFADGVAVKQVSLFKQLCLLYEKHHRLATLPLLSRDVHRMCWV
jgi:hypothetical protein